MRHTRRHTLHIEDPATGNRYPVPQGGAEDDPPADSDDSAPEDDPDESDDSEDSEDDDADQLGDAGKKALDRMKEERRELKATLREYKALGKSPEEIKQLLEAKADSSDDDAPDPETVRKTIEEEVRAEAARDRALDKLEAKAARKFHNPDIARQLLAEQADSFLDAQGNPDVEEINDALDDLLKREPYLAVTDATPSGSTDAGSRTPPSKPGQLSRTDLSNMTPEDIDKARKDGRLNDLMGVKS